MKKNALLMLSLPFLAMVIAGCGGGGGSGSKPDQSNTSTSGAVPSVDTSTEPSQGGDEGEDVAYNGKLKVYYHNDAGNYANKRIWAWGNGVDGDEYPFDNQTAADDYGVYKIFDLNEGVWKGMVSTTFSFIIKNAGTWSGVLVPCRDHRRMRCIPPWSPGREWLHIALRSQSVCSFPFS